MVDINEPIVDKPIVDAVEMEVVFECGELGAMLEVVADKLGMTGIPGERWIDAVLVKLNDVGVETVKDFMIGVLTVNRRLIAARHRPLHEMTLEAMLIEANEMMG
jgi:hypothetical protein